MLRSLLVSVLLLAAGPGAATTLLNGGFEDPDLGDRRGFDQLDPVLVRGWDATEGTIEIWANGFNNVRSFEGSQHAEINARNGGALFQEVSNVAQGADLILEFAHRARQGTDVMRVEVMDLGDDGAYGTADDTALFDRQFSATTQAWIFSSTDDFGGLTALGGDLRLSFFSISTGSGNASVGNFLDAVAFGLDLTSPPPSVIPVPAAGWLLLGGLGALGLARRRRRA